MDADKQSSVRQGVSLAEVAQLAGVLYFLAHAPIIATVAFVAIVVSASCWRWCRCTPR
jgi:hypothetical protein